MVETSPSPRKQLNKRLSNRGKPHPSHPDSSSPSSEATIDTIQSGQVEAPSRSRQPVRESETVQVETGRYHIIFSVGRFAYAHEWALKRVSKQVRYG